MKAKVYVTLKNGVLDPQGKAIQQALETLGHTGIQEVRTGKFFEIELQDPSRLKEMAEKLLANCVIEDYKIEMDPRSDSVSC